MRIKKKIIRKKVEYNIWSSGPTKANSDLTKLLISDETFQKDVLAGRHDMGIPTLAHDCSQEKLREILDDLFKNSEDLMESEKFIKEEFEIKRKLRDGEINMNAYRFAMGAHLDKIFPTKLHHYAEFLTEKYNLPYNFVRSVEQYLLYGIGNNMSIPIENFSVGYDRTDVRSYKDSKNVIVRIYAQLTHEEYGRLEKTLNRYSKILTKHNAIHEIDRKLEYEKWYKDAKYYDSEKDIMRRSPLTELAEENLGSKKKVQDIKNAVRELKHLRNTNLTRKRVG